MADSDIEKRLLLSSETPKLGSDRPILSPTRLSGQRPARQLAFKLCLALFCFLAGIGFASTVGLPASRLTVAQRASEWMRTTLYGEREIVIEVDRPIKKFDKSQVRIVWLAASLRFDEETASTLTDAPSVLQGQFAA